MNGFAILFFNIKHNSFGAVNIIFYSPRSIRFTWIICVTYIVSAPRISITEIVEPLLEQAYLFITPLLNPSFGEAGGICI